MNAKQLERIKHLLSQRDEFSGIEGYTGEHGSDQNNRLINEKVATFESMRDELQRLIDEKNAENTAIDVQITECRRQNKIEEANKLTKQKDDIINDIAFLEARRDCINALNVRLAAIILMDDHNPALTGLANPAAKANERKRLVQNILNSTSKDFQRLNEGFVIPFKEKQKAGLFEGGFIGGFITMIMDIFNKLFGMFKDFGPKSPDLDGSEVDDDSVRFQEKLGELQGINENGVNLARKFAEQWRKSLEIPVAIDRNARRTSLLANIDRTIDRLNLENVESKLANAFEVIAQGYDRQAQIDARHNTVRDAAQAYRDAAAAAAAAAAGAGAAGAGAADGAAAAAKVNTLRAFKMTIAREISLAKQAAGARAGAGAGAAAAGAGARAGARAGGRHRAHSR